MELLHLLFMFIKSVLDKQITIGSFTFTLWDVFVFTIIASIIGWVLGKMINVNSAT